MTPVLIQFRLEKPTATANTAFSPSQTTLLDLPKPFFCPELPFLGDFLTSGPHGEGFSAISKTFLFSDKVNWFFGKVNWLTGKINPVSGKVNWLGEIICPVFNFVVSGACPKVCVRVGFMFYRFSGATGGEINRSPNFSAN